MNNPIRDGPYEEYGEIHVYKIRMCKIEEKWSMSDAKLESSSNDQAAKHADRNEENSTSLDENQGVQQCNNMVITTHDEGIQKLCKLVAILWGIAEGYAYFNSMTKVYGISPRHEHHACMVDLLGRAGRLDDAKKFIETMPIKPDSTILGALLGACANHGNLEMGREFAERLFELEPENP
ncbi:hypothetical protein LWI28_025989 [Acer negundo]|uniref:Pentatricopeptide repeat-containing protein n=1 Tax=Acer negundo TaxID=4023 RepID=A0AAD5NGF4_ACENE|nr:hypothetical protein LWI28_025989 [Acer negundo]